MRQLFRSFLNVAVNAVALLVAGGGVCGENAMTARIVDVRMIWNEAPHNAFTDLIRWREKWYCAFREGERHVGDRGALRVIASDDGKTWRYAARLEMPGADLRDAALSVTPDDRLMLLGGARNLQTPEQETSTVVAFSDDGARFTPPKLVGAPGRWLWRVTWHGDRAYGVSYPSGIESSGTALLSTADGVNYETLVPRLVDDGQRPNEARVRFDSTGTAYCLHRREGPQKSALLGTARPPYADWTWADLGQHVGGPNFIQIPSGAWIGAGRLHAPDVHTSVMLIDVDRGTMRELVRVPSGGDTSYPGLAWHEGELWMSYYSSHERGTSIYLARIAIEPAADDADAQAE